MNKIPLHQIEPFAEALKKALVPYCEQIAIAGSPRGLTPIDRGSPHATAGRAAEVRR